MNRLAILSSWTLGLLVAACVPLLGDFEMGTTVGAGGDAAGGSGGEAGGGAGAAAPTEFALTAPAAAEIVVGRSASVPINVVSGDGFDAEVVVTVVGLPAGVTADPLTITGAETGDLVLHAAATAAVGETTSTVVTGVAGEVSHTAPLAISVVGVPGTIDSSFGTLGTATDPIGAFFHADGARVLPDGSVLVVGDYSTGTAFVARYTPEGEVDTSYGTDGKASIVPGGYGSQYVGFAAADDGSVLLAVRTWLSPDYRLAFMKLRPDGQPDTTFGMNGTYVEETTASEEVTLGPLFPLADGRFLAFLRGLESGRLERRAESGVSDASWTGTNTFASGYEPSRLGLDAALNPIALCSPLAIARLTPTGDHDSGFGLFDDASGMYLASTDFGMDAGGTFGAFVSHQNRIYAVATVSPPGGLPSGAGLAAFDSQGSAVADFGTDGTTELLFGSPSSEGTTGDQLLVEQEAFLVLLGTSVEAGVGTFLLARYGLDGQQDPSFGEDGLAIHPAGSWGRALALGRQPNGRLLMVGATSGEVVLARYWP